MLLNKTSKQTFNKELFSNSDFFEFLFSSSNENLTGLETKYSVKKDSINDISVTFSKKTNGTSISTPFSSKEIGQITTTETDKLVSKIYASFLNDDIEFGNDSKTQKMVEALIVSYGADFIDNVLVNLFTKHIVIGKSGHMSKFMMLLSAFEAEQMPLICNVAITALAHKKYNSVKESVLITIESWRYKGAIRLLEDMEPYSRAYLEEYKQKIIRFLKDC